jgi:hypothetical protein
MGTCNINFRKKSVKQKGQIFILQKLTNVNNLKTCYIIQD